MAFCGVPGHLKIKGLLSNFEKRFIGVQAEG
jgi:hypothetical protein